MKFLPLLLPVAMFALGSSASASENRLDLAGEWKCSLDNDDQGIAQKWWDKDNAAFPHAFPMPGTTDLAKLGEANPPPGPNDAFLTRRYRFVGPAWYVREFDVPESWRGLETDLVLERVMWQSRVWVDGREAGPALDSLCVPHVHGLGQLTPGRHRLVMRVDNRMIHPIGDKGHGYGDQTQSRWNGVIGSVGLVAREATYISNLRVFPAADGTVECEVAGTLGNDAAGTKLRVSFSDPATGTKPAATAEAELTGAGPFTKRITLRHPGKPQSWSEFVPHLCKADASLLRGDKVVSSTTSEFGFREAAHDGNRLLINGRPAFMRGNLECAVFPKTGHPPTDVASWARIWKIYKEHGLNNARFHSWCPPEAAFTAADAAGVYLQVETPSWMDSWMAGPTGRPDMDTEGFPKGLGNGDRTIDAFIHAEMGRILDTYGNHPSFVFFCIGNELGTANFKVTRQWIADAKKHDPRHLYAASTARAITPDCDFNATHAVPGIGGVRQHLQPSTDWDYEAAYKRTTVPIIAHEIGQWPVYMNWEVELPRYDGPLAPLRLEKMRDEAGKAGLLPQAPDLCAASGVSNRVLYRDEIESFLRTPSCRGFHLLGMQDFPGQAEAMVGWLDPFYISKGTTDPAKFRHYCGPSVPLLRVPGYVFATADRPEMKAQFFHYGKDDLAGAECSWTLTEPASRRTVDSGKLGCHDFATGGVYDCGSFKPSFAAVRETGRYDLELRVGDSTNTYPLWVYASAKAAASSPAVHVSAKWDDETKDKLSKGGRVLLIANQLGGPAEAKHAQWLPLYWSVPFFPGQGRDTLGLLVQDKHPAFKGFPTGIGAEWNWYRICAGAHGFDLTDLVPHDFRPLAQPVTDFHLNRRLGTIFELRVGRGSLLVCGYDISDARAAALPEVGSLRRALISYASSSGFTPHTALPADVLDDLFGGPKERLAKVPERFKNADLLVRAGALTPGGEHGEPWNPKLDATPRKADGVDYSVECDGVWKDGDGTAWYGNRKLKVTVKSRPGVPGKFYVRFHDWNVAGRSGKVTFEGTERDLGPHPKGVWMEFDVIREDTNDGRLILTAETTGGPNLMITDIAFVPKE